jgi:diguanylate cyclase (GGDEF)-like protein
LNGNHGEVSQPLIPADEWQDVDAIGFKAYLPLVESPEQIESGELSAQSAFMINHALDSRERASKNHRSYREQQALAEENHKMARTDALTGLGNRKALEEEVELRFSRTTQKDEPLVTPGLVFIDIDGFKAINDIEGHGKGDDVLVEIAVKLQSIVRKGDIVFRLGGDEFVILTEQDTALNERRNKEIDDDDLNDMRLEGVAGRIINSSELGEIIDFNVSEAARDAGSKQKVGASIGYVTHRANETYADFLGRADNAMYVSKNNKKKRAN